MMGTNKDIRLLEEVMKKERNESRVRRQRKRSIWAGFGLFGIVGWSVAIPTLVGTALGRWLDKHYPQTFSWTISLLTTGLIVGCYTAWYWIRKEYYEMHDNNNNNTDSQ
jgi:ATP synthase protein I